MAPANEAFRGAAHAPVPSDWMDQRVRWETGHAIRFALQLLALALMTLSIAFETPDGEPKR